jgi:hypothetical protein
MLVMQTMKCNYAIANLWSTRAVGHIEWGITGPDKGRRRTARRRKYSSQLDIS